MVAEKITKSDYFSSFEIFSSPEIVKEFETFDLFYFTADHVARRPSDSYFIEKTDNKENNILLRPHTTVLWYHYLV
jgi:phenylalanyl-tRNA synthetase alpha subunit